MHEIDYYPKGSPERHARENHRWANTKLGWIEWAHGDLSPESSVLYQVINSRAPSGKDLYHPPVPGGRTRADGVVLKWTVTPSVAGQGSGNIPFFCQDLTPRRLRVRCRPFAVKLTS